MVKYCTGCKVEKDIEYFGRKKRNGVHPKGLCGYESQCLLCMRKRYKKYNDANKERRRTKMKEHYYKHRQRIIKDTVQRRKQRCIADPQYKLMCNIRSYLHQAVNTHFLSKQLTTMEYLGCDQRTLLEWLQWSGERYDIDFNILDYDGSEYHIDHIKTFEDVAKGVYTLEEVAHYTNLQILTAEENLSKGGTSWIE